VASQDDIKNITELLLDKQDLVTSMLTLTKATKFYGTTDDADNYINLMEARQNNIDRIIEIDKKLGEPPFADLIKSPTKELQTVIDSVKDTIRADSDKIIQLDTANKQAVDNIITSLKGDMKGFNRGKNMRQMYQNDSRAYSGYTKIDTKK